MTPNHADKTQPVQHSKAEGPGEGTCPQTTAPRSCRPAPGGLSQPPPCCWLRADVPPPPLQSQRKEEPTRSEHQRHVASGFAGSTLLETHLSRRQPISQVGGAWQEGRETGPWLRPLLLPARSWAHSERGGRARRSLRSAEGTDLRQVTQEGVAPLA